MNPFADQVGGDHYKNFAFDPFKVCANWPKWAGDVFTYLIRKKGQDDYQKAMHTMAMWMDMESKPQSQPLASELTRHWVEMSQDALDPMVTDVIVTLGGLHCGPERGQSAASARGYVRAAGVNAYQGPTG